MTDDLIRKTQAQPGDLLLIAAGTLHSVVRYNRSVMRIGRQREGRTMVCLHFAALPSAPSIGKSSSAVCGAAGVSRPFSPRPFSLPLSLGGRLSSFFAQRRRAAGTRVGPSPVHSSTARRYCFTLHRATKGTRAAASPVYAWKTKFHVTLPVPHRCAVSTMIWC